MSALSNVPGLAGFLEGQQIGERQQMGQLQQVGALQGILAQVQAQKQKQAALMQEQELRGALAQLGPNPSQESLATVAAKYAPAKDILTSQTASADRKAGAENARLLQANLLADRLEGRTTADQTKRDLAGQADTTRRDLAADADRRAREMQQFMVANRAPQQPQPVTTIVVKDASSDTGWSYKDARTGRVTSQGAPPPASDARTEKVAEAKRKTVRELNQAIVELERATADKGLIDKSTGSGAGAIVDAGAAFFGKATPGAIASGQMAPIFDLALKMVPRFEGPQSDKDTKSYQEAAGKLSNPNTPNETKKMAGKEVLRLMKARREQFISKDLVGTDADTAPAAAPAATPTPKPSRRLDDVPAGIDPKVWGAMTPEEKKLFK